MTQGTDFFGEDGFPPSGGGGGSAWRGRRSGLYAVGFTRRGLSGIAQEAERIAEELGKAWREETRSSW